MGEKRPALGRGLSALLPEPVVSPAAPADQPLEVEVDRLRPNRFQPRAAVDHDRLQELARSIRANGVIQPIVARRAGEAYEIVAGERRWRAAQLAGLARVPVIVRSIPDEQLLATALIENIQREDLNPIEEANAYRRLIDEFRLTQEQVADAVGKDRSSVANYLRLLKLSAEIQAEVAAGRLSMGHARALLSLTDGAAQRRVAREVVARGLSVRETEALVKRLAAPPRAAAAAPPVDANTRAAEERLRFALGARVRIVRRGKGGRIEILFSSEEELHRLFEQLVDSSGGRRPRGS
jgi:ParB family chromosome partitioning protein